MGDNVDKDPSKPDTEVKSNAFAATQPNTLTVSPSQSRRFRSPTGQNVLLLLIGFRLLNALTVQTFFQPDEYFQALEPAWRLAFGKDAGAWITWVRNSHNALTVWCEEAH